MSRRSKDKNEAEHLRGIIRQMRAENKQLRKQLARSDKEILRAVDTVNAFVDDIYEEDFQAPLKVDTIKCSKCRSKMTTLELGPRIVYTCSNEDCKYRQTVKK